MSLKAYTKGITKEQFVTETKKHQAMDAFIKGTYSEKEDGQFKGCAVGCAIESINTLKGVKLDNSAHAQYEGYLGVPEWLARLEDTLFENLSLERSKSWPVEFAEAINEGADLDAIKVPFIVYLMNENLSSVRIAKYDEDSNPDVKKAIDLTEAALLQMIEAQESGDSAKITAAESAARSAAESAESAARSAAESARSAAESAARSAAESAESAAWSAWSAAWSADESARSAAWSAESAAWSADESARSAAFEKHADKILELLKGCE